MRMVILLKVTDAFDREKLNHPLVTRFIDVIGRYNLVIDCDNIDQDQGLAIINNLKGDSSIELFTPLLEYVY